MSESVAVSLFSGIGGFEAGFSQAGITTKLMCEKDPSAQAVLRSHFPDSDLFDDVVELKQLPECSIVVGGWPCQDLSQAGRMAGLNGPQSSLVSEVFRLLDASPRKPNAVLLENVAFALSLKQGESVRHVTTELAARGYRWAYRILDTREFGLPHRRRRIFICGMLEGDPGGFLFEGLDRAPAENVEPMDVGFYWTEGNRGVGWTVNAFPPLKGGSGLHIPSPPALWNIESGLIRTPSVEDAERLQGFPAHWTLAARDFKRGDRGRWRLIGNAVSVPVAAWLASRLVAPTSKPVDYDEGIETRVKHVAAFGGPSMPTRYLSGTSEGPANPKHVSVAEFGLLDAASLSKRAAEGFLRRYMRSGLIKRHDFAEALANHCGLTELPS